VELAPVETGFHLLLRLLERSIIHGELHS
jgi:hypothetical protein